MKKICVGQEHRDRHQPRRDVVPVACSSPITSTPAQFLLLVPQKHIPGNKFLEKRASHQKSRHFQQGQNILRNRVSQKR